MSTPFDVRRWAEQAGIQTTGGFAVVAECVTLDELQRFADIAIATAAKHWQRAHAIAALAEPVQEPVAWRTFDGEGGYDYCSYDDNEDYRKEYIKRNGEKYTSWVEPLYTSPPDRKSLSITDLQEALVYTGIVDRDAIDDPDEYDEGSTLAQIDELHRIIHRHLEDTK